MRKNFTLKLIALITIISAVTFSSCKKASEAIDEKIDEMLDVKALTEEPDATSSNYNEITDLVINNKLFTSGTEMQMTLPASVPYSFTKTRHSLSEFWTLTTDKYSGTIPKSMFTNTTSANTVKILTLGNTPTLFVNGSTVSSSGTGTGDGTGDGTGTTHTLIDQVIAGDIYQIETISVTVPSGVNTLQIKTTESAAAYYNTADLFVHLGSAPVIVVPNASNNYAKYSCSNCGTYYAIGVNRDNRVVNVTNPTSGTWYISLYGYNTYFSSRLLITYTK